MERIESKGGMGNKKGKERGHEEDTVLARGRPPVTPLGLKTVQCSAVLSIPGQQLAQRVFARSSSIDDARSLSLCLLLLLLLLLLGVPWREGRHRRRHGRRCFAV